jgi:hypothetical protein
MTLSSLQGHPLHLNRRTCAASESCGGRRVLRRVGPVPCVCVRACNSVRMYVRVYVCVSA